MCNKHKSKPEKKKPRPRPICEMRRWSISVFLALGLCGLLIGSIVLLLHGRHSPEEENLVDIPLHPISSTSYSKAASGSGVVSSHAHPHQDYRSHPHDPSDHTAHRDNYRKRFSDAIKGVFNDILGKNSSHANQNENPTKESTENNSSRLKRQLDFGSASEEQNDKKVKRTPAPTTPAAQTKSTTRPKPPILRLIKAAGIPARSASSIPDSSSSSSSSSSEEAKDEDSKPKNTGKYQRKAVRRFRPRYRNLASSEHENEDYNHSPEGNRKNFTYEVVEVQRKVVRKEDGHVPSHFAKNNYRIEPRLTKISKKDVSNKPAVIYRKSSSPQVVDRQRASRRLGKASEEVAQERSDTSVEDTDEEDNRNDNSDNGRGSQEKRVVINSKELIPHHENLSDEDLKDYHDGHSTFGSKGNFTHTIISRNVAGYLPNPGGPAIQSDTSHELSRRSGRSKDGRKIVIERGRVRENHPNENSRENQQSPEVYSVPGGRTSSTENYESNKQAFPFQRTQSTKTSSKGGDASSKESDRTSPVITSSLEDLYRKGHPGVVRAPQGQSATRRQRHPLAEPYGDSADYGGSFGYNPLVDEPPLKFDPASDRFYGNPVPDNKERVAQSNSPVRAESRNGGSRASDEQDYLKPAKRSRSTEDEVTPGATARVIDEDGTTSSESPQEDPQNNHPNDRFYYGRAYNSPDYSADYENTEKDRDNENDLPAYDFVGLDENFDSPRGVGSGDDFFDFPGGNDFRPRGGNSQDDNDNSEPPPPSRSENDYDEGRQQPRPPPSSSGTRNSDPEYDTTNSREDDNGRFRPVPNDGRRDDDEDDEDQGSNPEVYDTGFIETLKQFDEEIRKLQHAERKKLLDSPPVTQTQNLDERRPAIGYRGKEPPLIITSPGPLENSYTPTESDDGDHGVTTTSRIPDDDVHQSRPESTENGSHEDSTVAPQDDGDDGQDEEEEVPEGGNTDRSVGGESSELSTERSGENEEEEKKK